MKDPKGSDEDPKGSDEDPKGSDAAVSSGILVMET